MDFQTIESVPFASIFKFININMFASLRNKFSNYRTRSFASWRCLPQGPELHLDVSALQKSVLLLEVSATGPELHLDVSALQRSALLLEVSATGPELYLDVSALQRSVLLLEVSAKGPELHLDVSAL
jgi:hypothetical protein